MNDDKKKCLKNLLTEYLHYEFDTRGLSEPKRSGLLLALCEFILCAYPDEIVHDDLKTTTSNIIQKYKSQSKDIKCSPNEFADKRKKLINSLLP